MAASSLIVTGEQPAAAAFRAAAPAPAGSGAHGPAQRPGLGLAAHAQ